MRADRTPEPMVIRPDVTERVRTLVVLGRHHPARAKRIAIHGAADYPRGNPLSVDLWPSNRPGHLLHGSPERRHILLQFADHEIAAVQPEIAQSLGRAVDRENT